MTRPIFSDGDRERALAEWVRAQMTLPIDLSDRDYDFQSIGAALDAAVSPELLALIAVALEVGTAGYANTMPAESNLNDLVEACETFAHSLTGGAG